MASRKQKRDQGTREVLHAAATLDCIKDHLTIIMSAAGSAGDTLTYSEAAHMVRGSATSILMLLGEAPKEVEAFLAIGIVSHER